VPCLAGRLGATPIINHDYSKNSIINFKKEKLISANSGPIISKNTGIGPITLQEGPLTFKEASRIAYPTKGSIVGTGKYKPTSLTDISGN